MNRIMGTGSAFMFALAAAACGSTIDVHTMVAPEANFTTQGTFRVLDAPVRRDGRPTTGADDPMVNNSIANRALRERITKAFTERGYQSVDREPDFAVAFYASARETIDVSAWDYGYPIRSRWPRPVYQQTVTEVLEGSVVVDVIDPRTQELLWRGEGTARLSDDPAENVKELAKAAEAVVRKFPAATRR
jgi:Domain of unknown function (DUF4136)